MEVSNFNDLLGWLELHPVGVSNPNSLYMFNDRKKKKKKN
jgi:hypothetical protein